MPACGTDNSSSTSAIVPNKITLFAATPSVILSKLILADPFPTNNQIFSASDADQLTEHVEVSIRENYQHTIASSYAQLDDFNSSIDALHLTLSGYRFGKFRFRCRRAGSPLPLSESFSFYAFRDFHLGDRFA